MDIQPPRLYKWHKPIAARETASQQADLTEEERAAMADLAKPQAPQLPKAEAEPGSGDAPAPVPAAEEPVVFAAPEHVQIQTREEQLEEIRQMGLGDLCMDDPSQIAMPDWAGGGVEPLGETYDAEEEEAARRCTEDAEEEAPDAEAQAPGPAPSIDDEIHEPTDPELIQLNELLQGALTALGHKAIEFGWDRDPNHGASPLCLPFDEYMKEMTTSEEENYDSDNEPDWDNYPFKWGGVVPKAWALEFIAKYLKEHDPNNAANVAAPAPSPSTAEAPAPAEAAAPAPAEAAAEPAVRDDDGDPRLRQIEAAVGLSRGLLDGPDYVDVQKRVLGAAPSEVPAPDPAFGGREADMPGEIRDDDLVAPGLALLQQQ